MIINSSSLYNSCISVLFEKIHNIHNMIFPFGNENTLREVTVYQFTSGVPDA